MILLTLRVKDYVLLNTMMNFMETQTISFVEKEAKVEGSQHTFRRPQLPVTLRLIAEAASPSCSNVIHYLFSPPPARLKFCSYS